MWGLKLPGHWNKSASVEPLQILKLHMQAVQMQVEPLLEVLVGKTLEQGLIRVTQWGVTLAETTQHVRTFPHIAEPLHKASAYAGGAAAGGADWQDLGAGADGGDGRRGAGSHACPPAAL